MKKLLTALMILAAAATLKASTEGYVMLSVFSPGQIPIAATSLNGVRLNALYGECQNLNGIDVGVFGRVRENVNGLQVSAVSSVGTDVVGAQLGLVNVVEADFVGFQLALWNDVGATAKGFQLGLVNRANMLEGLQIGLLNFIDEPQQTYRCLPIVNLGWERAGPGRLADWGFLNRSKMENVKESDTSRHFLRQWIEEDVAAGRTGGTVVTRFPPEPNGYIHIGHAKAVCVDFGMAQLFGGECHLRLDDTNPAKESDEYAENIKNDIRWLGFQWSGPGDAGEAGFYNASNMFEKMYRIAEELIRRGQAYCCNLTQEEWKDYRGVPEKPGRPSPSRDTDPERNLRIFHEMRDGKYADGEWCLRAKIDMASPNIHFRDPVLYRIRHVAHYHLGNAWCVYPMYDFAHPIEDALEGVTHSMCTLEFEVHRPLYDWVVDRMDEQGLLTVRNGVKIRPHQREFARLNITWTVMSKRLLLQLVTEKHVSGWDDPRMPTVCAMRRRGFPPAAIRAFCERVGVTKIESESDPALLEWCVREELNKTAARRMAVLDPVKLVIENFTGTRTVTKPNNPLDAAAGTREIPFSRELWIDRADFQENPEKKFFRLAPGREVRLAGACIVTCTGFEKDAEGKITLIRCTWDEGSWGGNPSDGRKVKGTIHWVDAATAVPAEVRLYDRLFTVPDPLRDGPERFLDYMNRDSLKTGTAYVEPALAAAAPGERFQFERTGYFVADTRDSKPGAPVFNRTVTLKDSYRPA